MPGSIGTATKTKILKSESHKLSHEFTASESIRKGALVVLTADGKIAEADTTSKEMEVIGYAVHTRASGELVTVVLRGYTILNALAGEASLDAGPVAQDSFDSDSGLWKYKAADAGTDPVHGWNLNQSTLEGDAITVIIKD